MRIEFDLSKAVAEEVIKAYAREFGLEELVARLAFLARKESECNDNSCDRSKFRVLAKTLEDFR